MNRIKRILSVLLSVVLVMSGISVGGGMTSYAAVRTDLTTKTVTSITVTPALIDTSASASGVVTDNKVSFGFHLTTPTGYPLTAGDTVEFDTNIGTLFSGMDDNTGVHDIPVAPGVTATFSGTKVTLTFGTGFVDSTDFSGTVITPNNLPSINQGQTNGTDVTKQLIIGDNNTNVVFHTTYTKPNPRDLDPNCINNKWVEKGAWGAYFEQCATIRLHSNYMGALALAKKNAGNPGSLSYISDWTPTTNNLIEDVIPGDGVILPYSVNIYAIALGSFTATDEKVATNTVNHQGWPVGAKYPQEAGSWWDSQAGGAVSGYTLLTQNSGETYDQFKTRIKGQKNSYGIYTSASGGDTFIANVGDANYTDGSGDHADVVGIRFNVAYPNLTTTTPYHNSANMSCDAGDLGGSEADYTIKRPDGAGIGNIGTLYVFVGDDTVDSHNNPTPQPIDGAVFKIQEPDGSGGWKDVIVGGNPVTATSDADGKLIFKNLTVSQYKVVQTSTPNGYSFTSDNFSGDSITAGGEFTVSADDRWGFIASIINSKSTDPDDITVTPSVSKVLTGATPSTASTFEFKMTAGAATDPMPTGSTSGAKTVTRTGAGTVDFGAITYTKDDKDKTYTYTFTETAGSDTAHYTYDSSSYTMTIAITLNTITNKLESAVTYKKGTAAATAVEFSNKYTADPDDIIVQDPPISKKITGDARITESEFKFTMTAANTTDPMPAGSVGGVKTLTRIGEGSVEFGDITYTKDDQGTYVYTLAETDTGIEGYTYDTGTYTMTVVIGFDSTTNKLTKDVSYKKGTDTVTECIFTNNYSAPKTNIRITKVWLDNDDAEGIRPDEITVVLKQDDIIIKDNVVLSAANNWVAEWDGELPITAADGHDYVYTVEEPDVPDGYTCYVRPYYGDNNFYVMNYHGAEGSISVNKVWDDNNDRYGKRPDTVTVGLFNKDTDEQFGSDIVLMADASGAYTYTWNDVPMFATASDAEPIPSTPSDATPMDAMAAYDDDGILLDGIVGLGGSGADTDTPITWEVRELGTYADYELVSIVASADGKIWTVTNKCTYKPSNSSGSSPSGGSSGGSTPIGSSTPKPAPQLNPTTGSNNSAYDPLYGLNPDGTPRTNMSLAGMPKTGEDAMRLKDIMAWFLIGMGLLSAALMKIKTDR